MKLLFTSTARGLTRIISPAEKTEVAADKSLSLIPDFL